MAKDERDKLTIDALPKKVGRPVIYPEHGPMSGAEYQRRHRIDTASVQVRITRDEEKRLKKYCEKHQVTKCDLVRAMIRKLRMKTPPDF